MLYYFNIILMFKAGIYLHNYKNVKALLKAGFHRLLISLKLFSQYFWQAINNSLQYCYLLKAVNRLIRSVPSNRDVVFFFDVVCV